MLFISRVDKKKLVASGSVNLFNYSQRISEKEESKKKGRGKVFQQMCCKQIVFECNPQLFWSHVLQIITVPRSCLKFELNVVYYGGIPVLLQLSVLSGMFSFFVICPHLVTH